VLRTIFAVGWILNGTLTLDLGFSPHPSFCFAKMPPRANLLANFAGCSQFPVGEGYGRLRRLPKPRPYRWVQATRHFSLFLVLETFFSIVKKGFKLPKKYSCTKHGALPHTPLAF
jgi:hypothetical protein